MEDEMISRLVLFGCGIAALIGLVIYVLKDVFKACVRGNRVAPENTTHQEPALEMQQLPNYDVVPNEPTVNLYLPTYEEATSGQPRRRRVSPKDNITPNIAGTDDTGTNTASAAGEKSTGDGGEYSGINNTGDDSGVRLNLEDDIDMNASGNDGGNTSTANDSGIKFGGEDTADRLDADSMSKYDTASETSGGSYGRKESASPLPWSSV